MSVLGGVIEFDQSIAPPTIDRVTLARRRPAIRAQILACTRCPLSRQSWVRAPVPWSGRSPADFAIVGEAPGERENRQSAPFVGPAGQLLRSMLADANLDVDRALIANTVCCYPAGTPDELHVRACRTNLEDQLALAATPFVLLFGGVALSAFRPGLKVTAMAGRTFVQGGRVFMVVLHPAFVLRQRQLRDEVVGHLEGFRWLMRGELAPSHLFGVRCATGCGGMVDHYDPEGVGMCGRCWAKRVPSPTEVAERKAVEIAKKVKVARKRAALQRQGMM